MKPCEARIPELVDAAEGTIPPTLGAHLAECEGCRAALAELRGGLELLRPAPAPEPDPWLATRVRHRVESGRRRRRVLTALFPAAAAAAALAVVLLPRPPEPAPLPEAAIDAAIAEAQPIARLPAPSELDAETLAGLEANVLGEAIDEAVLDDGLGWEDAWGLDVEAALADADAEAVTVLLDQLPG